LKELLAGYQTYELFRKQFVFNEEKFRQLENWRDQIPAGFTLHPIDRALLQKVGADMFPWPSPEAFLKNGFGFWLMQDGDLICECSTVFVGGGAVETNIHTAKKHRKMGLATLNGAAFIEHCLKSGLRPNWECWWDNESSAALAQKLGFEETRDHPVTLVELN